MVSGLHVAHLFANEFHDAGRFVTQDHWHWMAVVSIDVVQVGSADSTSSGSYEYFMSLRFIYLHCFDTEWLADFPEYGCFHRFLQRVINREQIKRDCLSLIVVYHCAQSSYQCAVTPEIRDSQI